MTEDTNKDVKMIMKSLESGHKVSQGVFVRNTWGGLEITKLHEGFGDSQAVTMTLGKKTLRKLLDITELVESDGKARRHTADVKYKASEILGKNPLNNTMSISELLGGH